jgi:hypothetical protein
LCIRGPQGIVQTGWALSEKHELDEQ